MLNADYFTIHPSKTGSRPPSMVTSSAAQLKAQLDEDDEEEQQEIKDIATLLMFLRKAAIDREKIVLVRNFIKNATDDLHYLAEQMPHIMSLFVFQNTRRYLLTILMEEVNAASDHREEHQESGKDENPAEKQRTDSLLQAIDAADQQVKRLEYWSDIRKVARKGETGGAVDDTERWPSKAWQGLDDSGAGNAIGSDAKEDGMSPQELQKDIQKTEEIAEEKAEERIEEQDDEEEVDVSTKHAMETEREAFVTAEEPVSLDKGKGKAS